MKKPQIFISYSWNDKEQTDIIDSLLLKNDIRVIRDVRDLEYSSNIKDFMNKIRSTDFVILLISDSFLKSSYCMYEVSQLIKDKNFLKRLLPIITSDADIYSIQGRFKYIRYWQEKSAEVNQKLTEITNMAYASPLIDEVKRYSNISITIGELIASLGEINAIRFESLSDDLIQIINKLEKPYRTPIAYEKENVEVVVDKSEFLKRSYKAFISYAHDDKIYFDLLLNGIKKHSKNLKYEWKIWDDTQIPIGKFWHEEIVNQIDDCDFAVLLVSSAFLYSKYIKQVEFNSFLKIKDKENFLFFPVLLEPCNYDGWEELSKRQFFLPNGIDYGLPKIKDLTYADLVRFDRDNYPIRDPMRERYHMDLIDAIENSLNKLNEM